MILEQLVQREPSPVLSAVIKERWRQDRKHGGPVHDDTHSLGDWVNIILDVAEGPLSCEDKLIQVVATALALLESQDRTYGKISQMVDEIGAKTLGLYKNAQRDL